MNRTNQIVALMLLAFINTTLISTPWANIIKAKVTPFNDPTFNIILEQHACVINNTAPTIADSIIKSITIVENEEPLVDIISTHNKRLSMLPNAPVSTPYYGPEYNAGLPNASRIRVTVYHKLTHMINYLDELAPLFGYQRGEISIKIFEGYRDLECQAFIFNYKLQKIMQDHPHLTYEEAEIETAKWVSPVKNNIPVHSTGASVDIRLWNETTSEFVDLGPFGVWEENKSAPIFSEDLTDTQKLNRLYLLMAATKAGLVNYTYEYWHFSYGDRYATYWQQADLNSAIACYGAVHEK